MAFQQLQLCGHVTLGNTHSIFADIIWAEIFEPNLSNLIPDSSHVFAHFCAFLAIPTFWEPLVHVPCTVLQPYLQLLHSITLTLIVSNCLSFSCCIMIRDIASMLHPFVPSKYCLHSSCIPDFVSSSI